MSLGLVIRGVKLQPGGVGHSLVLSSCTAREGQLALRLDSIRTTVTKMLELITGGDTTSYRKGGMSKTIAHYIRYIHVHVHVCIMLPIMLPI